MRAPNQSSRRKGKEKEKKEKTTRTVNELDHWMLVQTAIMFDTRSLISKWLNDGNNRDNLNTTKLPFAQFLTPLSYAASWGRHEIVQRLLKAKADPKGSLTGLKGYGEGMPLLEAATSIRDVQHEWISKWKAEAKEKDAQQDEEGVKKRPARRRRQDLAAKNADDEKEGSVLECVKLLLDAGADPLAQSSFGMTVIDHAMAVGNLDIARFLEDRIQASTQEQRKKRQEREKACAVLAVLVAEESIQNDRLHDLVNELDAAIKSAESLPEEADDNRLPNLLLSAVARLKTLRQAQQLGATLAAEAAIRKACDAAKDESSGEDAATRVAKLKEVINEHAADKSVPADLLKEARALRDRLGEEARNAKKKGKAAAKEEQKRREEAAKAEAEAEAREMEEVQRKAREQAAAAKEAAEAEAAAAAVTDGRPRRMRRPRSGRRARGRRRRRRRRRKRSVRSD